MRRERGNGHRRGRKIIQALLLILLLCAAGCSGMSRTGAGDVGDGSGAPKVGHEADREADPILEIGCRLFKNAEDEGRMEDLEMLRTIVNQFGENGYAAVDAKNQINMTEAQQVITFCGKVDAKEEGKLTLIKIKDEDGTLDGIVRYDLRTENGVVEADVDYYKYIPGASRGPDFASEGGTSPTGSREQGMEKVFTASFQAEKWQYTKDGYLLFSGSYFSEEVYVLTAGEVNMHAAFRVLPLDETCRELNREYMLPIGYERNNLFLVDWSEEDFGALDFYDLYDLFFPKVKGCQVPYRMDDDLGKGAVYKIPKEEFEHVIQSAVSIESATLQSKTRFDPEDASYEYRPRGFYETEYPEYPYPEVVQYRENGDGTVTLTVNVVFPAAGVSKVYAHEVVVRPLDKGGAQYVSNRVLPSEENQEASWHTPRLTDEKWEEMYGAPETGACLFSKEEKAQLQETALAAAGQIKEVYCNIEVADGPAYASNIVGFTERQSREAVLRLGQAGFTSVADGCNMENPEPVRAFYADYLDKRESKFTVFEVNPDGLIGAVTFLYRSGRLQTCYIGVGWQQGGIPEIRSMSVSDVAEINLTEKGYFIYAYENPVPHSSLRQYWRISPLSDQCRELTEKYISGLSYVNYNMLVTDWDSSNVGDILMPCMFEDIYRMDTGEMFRTQNRRVAADLYERIMTTYFPASAETVRERCGYDAESGSYPYEMIFARPYPPFGEVVGYTENGDGTLTLFVDGVWPDYNSDHAFTNQIVVLPFADGTFRYLSNRIEEKELVH